MQRICAKASDIESNDGYYTYQGVKASAYCDNSYLINTHNFLIYGTIILLLGITY